MTSLVPGKTLLMAAAGTAGAIVLGYCVYFDYKRRSDPNYKRKVRQRRQEVEAEKKMGMTGSGGHRPLGMPDSTDNAALELYFLNEIKTGEQNIAQGRIDEGLTHLANAITVCAQPGALIQMLQTTLPEQIFRPLMAKLQEMQPRATDSDPNTEEGSAEVTSTSSAIEMP